jgi:hypothetical protein
MAPTWVVAASMLLLTALSACGGGTDTAIPQEATPSRVPMIGEHDFAGIAWLSGGWLVVGLNPENVSAPNEFWRLHPDGEGFRRLSLPDDPACQRTDTRCPASGSTSSSSWPRSPSAASVLITPREELSPQPNGSEADPKRRH